MRSIFGKIFLKKLIESFKHLFAFPLPRITGDRLIEITATLLSTKNPTTAIFLPLLSSSQIKSNLFWFAREAANQRLCSSQSIILFLWDICRVSSSLRQVNKSRLSSSVAILMFGICDHLCVTVFLLCCLIAKSLVIGSLGSLCI